jgi:hypothetical protein
MFLMLAAIMSLPGQQTPLTITAAVEEAVRNYPSIRVSQE